LGVWDSPFFSKGKASSAGIPSQLTERRWSNFSEDQYFSKIQEAGAQSSVSE
jgi:hypothetical protein